MRIVQSLNFNVGGRLAGWLGGWVAGWILQIIIPQLLSSVKLVSWTECGNIRIQKSSGMLEWLRGGGYYFCMTLFFR